MKGKGLGWKWKFGLRRKLVCGWLNSYLYTVKYFVM